MFIGLVEFTVLHQSDIWLEEGKLIIGRVYLESAVEGSVSVCDILSSRWAR